MTGFLASSSLIATGGFTGEISNGDGPENGIRFLTGKSTPEPIP